jgi:hypothetical protein
VQSAGCTSQDGVIDDESLVKTRTNTCLRYISAVTSYSVTQASICPRVDKRFVINHAILASTTGTLYLPKPDKNFRLY